MRFAWNLDNEVPDDAWCAFVFSQVCALAELNAAAMHVATFPALDDTRVRYAERFAEYFDAESLLRKRVGDCKSIVAYEIAWCAVYEGEEWTPVLVVADREGADLEIHVVMENEAGDRRDPCREMVAREGRAA